MNEAMHQCGFAPGFPTYLYNGRRLLTSDPTSFNQVTSINFVNGTVVSTDVEHYDNDINRRFPNIFRHANEGSEQWLSRSMSSTEYGHIYLTTPTRVKIRTYRFIGYLGNDTDRGAATDVTLEAKHPLTGVWTVIVNIGHLGEGQDTGWNTVKAPFAATEFRVRFRALQHITNYFAGFRRFWLYG